MKTVGTIYIHPEYKSANLNDLQAVLKSIPYRGLINASYELKNAVERAKRLTGIRSPLYRPENEYCSKMQEFDLKKFEFIFDLMLHDCAVTYAYRAADESNRDLSGLTCDLWHILLQYRVDKNKD